MTYKLIKSVGLFIGAFMLNTAAAQAQDVNGIWMVEAQTAKVEIYDCGAEKCGKIVWLAEPNDENGNPQVDRQNPDESKRSEPLMGSQMIWGMEPDGANAWDGGKIYRATDGKEFNSKMELLDADTLEVSGCVLFVCREQTWTRDAL